MAACAPFWLGGAGDDGRTTARHAQAAILAISPRQQVGHIEDLADQPFLAATATVVDADSIAAKAPSASSQAPTVTLAEPVAPVPTARPQLRTRTMRMLVTAYCACVKCCGDSSDGVTASGKSIHANQSRFVAADTRLLGFGTRLSVPGYYGGAPVSVLDRGGKIKGRRLDVFFLSHERAKRWGARRLDVTVYVN